MMLRYGLNEPAAADLIEQAVLKVLDQGYRTGDLQAGPDAIGCKAMGDALLAALN